MMRMRTAVAMVLAATACCAVPVGDAAAVALGEAVSNLRFKDIRYLSRTLDELGAAQATVIVFTQSACDRSTAAMRLVDTLYRGLKDQGKGVVFLAINSGRDESIREMAWHLLRNEVFFPSGKDRDGACARELGVTRAGTVCILDAGRRLRYRGAAAEAGAALSAVLGGASPAPAETPVEGMELANFEVPAPDGPVTYATHIAAILNQHCVDCHRPNGEAPFALNTYKKAAAHASMIAEVTAEQRMPPWYAHPDFGRFRHDRTVPAAARLLVEQWVLAGAPEGDPALTPPAPEFPDNTWHITPDVITEVPMTIVLPASGFVPYQYVYLPYRFTEDTYVQAIQIMPSNPKVLHHGNLFFTRDGLQANEATDFLTGTVPGGMPSVLEGEVAWRIPKGGRLCLQLHHVTTGRIEQNRIAVGLRFARGVVNKQLRYKNMDHGSFAIPPHDPAHRVVSAYELEGDATGVGLFGHMHLRGRDMTFFAHYPDGRSEVLMSLPNYSFEWQLSYGYPPNTYFFPKGTRIECVAHYDNSAFNPFNPDPNKTVRHGPQTVDEMLNGFFVYTLDSEQLNLTIDPATGHAVTRLAAAE